MRRRTILSLTYLLCGCTVGGGKAVLPGGEDSPRDGAQGDGDGEPRDGTNGDGDGDPRDGTFGGDGDGTDTPRQDAGSDGDGTMSQPDAGGDGDGEPGPIPANCTQQSYGGHDYLFCSDKVWWAAARASCQSAGYDLVIIDSADENNFIRDHVRDDLKKASWLGLNDLDTEGTFVWIVPGESSTNGSPLGFEMWGDLSPDNCANFLGGSQHCVHMGTDGVWNDMSCDDGTGACIIVTETFPYVCESY